VQRSSNVLFLCALRRGPGLPRRSLRRPLGAERKEEADSATADERSRFAAADHEGTVLGTAVDAALDAYSLGICGSTFGKR